MNKKTKKWIWIKTGNASSTENLNEGSFASFDQLVYLVREAVQNTNDAFRNKGKELGYEKAIIKFEFNKAKNKDLSNWFTGLKEIREYLDQSKEHGSVYSNHPDYSHPNWLVITDTNTGGMQGDVDDRRGDWWNFLLNWGRSNKSSSNAGSKGVGRVNFLTSSQIRSLFIYSKRKDSDSLFGGLAMVNTSEKEDESGHKRQMSNYAILAKNEKENTDVYDLHSDHDKFLKDFQITDFKDDKSSGTSILIPFPSEDFDKVENSYDLIKSSFIENYAPLIIRGELEPWAGKHQINDNNVLEETKKVKDHFSSEEFKENGVEFIEFCRDSIYDLEENKDVIEIDLDERCDLDKFELDKIQKKNIIQRLDNGEKVLFKIKFKIQKEDENGKEELLESFIEAAFKRPSKDSSGNYKKSAEVYYRNGMALVSQQKHLASSDIHAALFCKDEHISSYLNQWEDDGHTEWKEGNPQKERARGQGYGTAIKPLRLCKHSLKNLYYLFTDEEQERDEYSLAKYFLIKKEKKKTDTKEINEEIERKISPYSIVEIAGGFRLKQNPKSKSLPKGIGLRLRYVSEPMIQVARYKPHDFNFMSLNTSFTNCSGAGHANELELTDLKPGYQIDIKGFDRQRELRIQDWEIK